MEKETIKNIRLGILMILGLLILIISLYFIGSNKNIFGSTFELQTTFKNINGLQVGNNVRFSGIDVGTVNKIEMKNDTTISVSMIIDSDMQDFIRTNSVASIGTDGLMGNRLVNIEPGSADFPFVEAGAKILSSKNTSTEAMMQTLESTNNNVEFVSANLKIITDNIRQSRGSMYSSFLDTSLSSDLHQIMDNIKSVTENLEEVSSEAATVMGEIKTGGGIAGALIYDTTMTNDLKKSVEDLRNTSDVFAASSRQLNEILNKINNGKGSASVILNDSVTAQNLQESISNLKMASIKLDEDLDGLKHSFLLRGYFRKQEKNQKKNIATEPKVNKKDSLQN